MDDLNDLSYQKGDRWLPHLHNDEDAKSDPHLGRQWAFQRICADNGIRRKDAEGEQETPPFKSWERDGNFETITVGMAGSWAPHVDDLAVILEGVRGAHACVTRKVGPAIYSYRLNHTKMPTDLPLDMSKFVLDQNLYYLGFGADGEDSYLDLGKTPHGIIAGESGSGKSNAAMLIALQHILAGGELIIVTPKLNDPKFRIYEELGAQVILGRSEEHIAQFHALTDRLKERIGEREEEKGTSEIYGGDRIMVIIDEYGYWTKLVTGEERPVAARKKKSAANLTEVAQQARETEINLVLMTQQPYAKEFGGSDALLYELLTWRLGIKEVSRKCLPDLFGAGAPAFVPETLGKKGSPPGRAVGAGLGTGEIMQIQLPYLPVDEQNSILRLGPDEVQALMDIPIPAVERTKEPILEVTLTQPDEPWQPDTSQLALAALLSLGLSTLLVTAFQVLA